LIVTCNHDTTTELSSITLQILSYTTAINHVEPFFTEWFGALPFLAKETGRQTPNTWKIFARMATKIPIMVRITPTTEAIGGAIKFKNC
jgi:hypothetical protein